MVVCECLVVPGSAAVKSRGGEEARRRLQVVGIMTRMLHGLIDSVYHRDREEKVAPRSPRLALMSIAKLSCGRLWNQHLFGSGRLPRHLGSWSARNCGG